MPLSHLAKRLPSPLISKCSSLLGEIKQRVQRRLCGVFGRSEAQKPHLRTPPYRGASDARSCDRIRIGSSWLFSVYLTTVNTSHVTGHATRACAQSHKKLRAPAAFWILTNDQGSVVYTFTRKITRASWNVEGAIMLLEGRLAVAGLQLAAACGRLTLFRLSVFFKIGEMVANQNVLSNRASDKSRVSRVGSIVIAVSRAFQKGGGRLLSEQGLAPYTRL
jgi:hypothetical protein